MRVELKCMICKGKYYSPQQDQLHESCGKDPTQGRKPDTGAVECQTPSPIQIKSEIEPSEKKIKKSEKVDKRSREYRNSIGR